MEEISIVPITSLTPTAAPPASSSIRAVVSLIWPYSSSTRQCALLLADPDFRLRNSKGQVRVRFTGASATAVAKGKVSIGDEVRLELRGAKWTEGGNVNTPGKSVDGELVFGGELGLNIVRKAGGEAIPDGEGIVTVQKDTPPPENEQRRANGVGTTPAWMRSSLGGADMVPIYSSPAFVKRLRLSQESTAFDSFAEVEKEVEEELEDQPRKKQRISFAGIGKWRLADRTPSPEKEAPSRDMDVDETTEVEQEETMSPVQPTSKSMGLQDVPHMPPPPLPRLQMPDETLFSQQQQRQRPNTEESDGPLTPKLQPVPSSALPLPSPFPTEGAQAPFGGRSAASTTQDTTVQEDANLLIEAAASAREAQTTARSEAAPATVAREDLLNLVDESQIEPPEIARDDQPATVSMTESLASTVAVERGDEPEAVDEDANADRLQMSRESNDVRQPHPEYLSDTEEDEEMYYDHMRRRFPSVSASGRIRVDHQEEGYYDNLSHIDEDDVEEVIDADQMGVEPEGEDSGEEGDDEDAEESMEVVEIQETLQPSDETAKKHVHDLQTKKDAGPSQTKPFAPKDAQQALKDAREEHRQETRETLKTPARPPPGLFGLDGAANDTPFVPKSTPQSERDRIMAKTYSSLFGFRASPSPELPKQQQISTPTPAQPIGHLSQIAKERAERPPSRMEELTAVPAKAVADIHEPGAAVPVDDDVHESSAAVEEAAVATEETGASVQAADVQDGSLLEAVLADGAKEVEEEVAPTKQPTQVEEESQPQESPVVNETLQPDADMEDAAEDPVPDGLAINKDLGEAIAPEIANQPPSRLSHPPASSAPKPSQVTVIDLGDSSDEEKEPDQETQKPSEQVNDRPSIPDRQPDTISSAAPQLSDPALQLGSQLVQDYSLSQAPTFAPSRASHGHTTQDSQGSALQSDMLDTTQTTVDRSEVVTPIAEEFDTVIPDETQEDTLWVNQGQQDGFFADQMNDQGFEGAAQPQLTQQTTTRIDPAADPYFHYFSFQSATSVATDNSENLPPTAVQSFAQEEHVAEPDTAVEPEEATRAEELPGTQQNTAIEITSSSPIAEPEDQQTDFAPTRMVVEETLQDGDEDMTEPDEPPVSEVASTTKQASEQARKNLSSPFQSFSQQAQRSVDASSGKLAGESTEHVTEDEVMADADESEQLEDSQARQSLSTQGHQRSHPTLPISPEESQSQHRIESMPFDTQLQIQTTTKKLPPTPQLTQGDSMKKEAQVVVDEAEEEEEHAQPEVNAMRRTRRSQGTADQTLQSPAKKTPVRRSPRKAPAESQESEKVAESQQEEQADADETIKPQRRRRSVQSQSEQSLLSPAKKTPVRRSPRKSHAPTESLEDEPEEPVVDSGKPVGIRKATPEHLRKTPEPEVEQSLVSPAKKTPIRRSARKSQAESQVPETVAEEDEDDEDTISVAPEKSSARQSAKKSQASQAEHKDMIEISPPTTKKTSATSRKSLTSRLGQVPEAISNWFSPRRSSRMDTEAEAPAQPVFKREKSNGTLTSLAYFTPLSNLEEKLNPGSQSYGNNTIDVLAVITDETKGPERAKTGRKDYFTIFHVTDTSLTENDSVRVEIYRPWHAVLPTAKVGDIVLLRGFAVKSRKRTPYLLSSDESAWCVWRYGEEERPNSPIGTRKRGASFSVPDGAREEVKGPPVELGEDERRKAAELRAWWVQQKEEKAVPVTPGRTTRSQKL